MTLVERRARAWPVAIALAMGCARGPGAGSGTPTPQAPASPLAGLVGQQMLVTPTQRARVQAELGWDAMPRGAELSAAMDSSLLAAFRGRDIARNWVFGDVLVRSYMRNPSYAADPRNLSVDPLRVGKLETGQRLPEPLATQVRTMIALQEGRLVLIPVELRVERGSPGAPTGRAVLRLVLVDPRSSDVRWTSEVQGDAIMAYGPALLTTLAANVANLFIAP